MWCPSEGAVSVCDRWVALMPHQWWDGSNLSANAIKVSEWFVLNSLVPLSLLLLNPSNSCIQPARSAKEWCTLITLSSIQCEGWRCVCYAEVLSCESCWPWLGFNQRSELRDSGKYPAGVALLKLKVDRWVKYKLHSSAGSQDKSSSHKDELSS